MLKNKILPTVVLTSICIVVALLLSVTDSFTSRVIEQKQKEKTAKTLEVVYPSGADFEEIDPEGKGLPESIGEIYAFADGGYVFKSTVSGHKSGLVILVGIDNNGAVTDTKYLESQETYGAEKVIDGQYKGQTAKNLTLVLESGSTKTSKAYKNAVSDSLSAFAILKGGDAQ